MWRNTLSYQQGNLVKNLGNCSQPQRNKDCWMAGGFWEWIGLDSLCD